MEKHRYPLGIQSFVEIRTKGYLYIDKTDYVYNLANGNAKNVFLGRPRRFGKSLLASTLHCYFEGRKELFEGLKIAELEKEWEQYPVLHFDMSKDKHMDEAQLREYLLRQMRRYESIYATERMPTFSHLDDLIEAAYKKTGKQVVVIIDEYDAPLLDVAHEGDRLMNLRHIMRAFYSPLKACDPYLRFVFFTGITKFSQLSIFSELNNIDNITMWDRFAGICGITKEELLTDMSEDIDLLAEKLKVSREEAIERLKYNYDGYHFSSVSPDIFNPFSLLTCFNRMQIGNYWFSSGTPTYLIEMMRKYNTLPSEIGSRIEATADDFDTPVETMHSIMPLMYQSGYVTIKDYSELFDLYTLDIPNNEVRIGLMKALLPNYIQSSDTNMTINRLVRAFYQNDMDGALQLLQKFFKTVPYCDNINYEGNWQQMLYVVFSLFGGYGDVEVHTSDGRVDLVMKLFGKLYLIETKIDAPSEEAMQQIDLKDYPARFSLLNLPIVSIGIAFSTKERGITSWQINEQDAA